MEPQSSPQCPCTVTVRRNPHRKARATPSANALRPPPSNPVTLEIPSFPTEEILAMQVPQTLSTPSTETLRVFLRIRPLAIQGSGKCGSRGNQGSKSTAKNTWPRHPSVTIKRKKNKNSEICVLVNNTQSVTLSPPSHLKDLKRIKSEVYEGFSHVFSADSSQEEVYERMANPLVEDFICGKSGMLAALGPSGSGKTHTVFGGPREPGMIPLALKQIFKRTEGNGVEATRSFYISMFEIYSERGKGERLLDLSPGGTDLFMQQSLIKGLQEVIISDADQAESLIAQAMLKRSTAITNSNSQSSRSQCIINIRTAPRNLERDIDAQMNNAVLTIVDLAGAEREKRTGNQGARLLESNFINNTSMVFGLCLRSLLEHQRNPKKPLQKHFQNSLLTKYLRDYLEGKKRMALILTIKPGEEDYLDSSFLLKQASPYMNIKFNNVEDLSDLVSNKRHVKAVPRFEQRKRMKFSDACVTEEGGSVGDERLLCGSDEEVNPEQLKGAGTVQAPVQFPKNAKLDANDNTFLKLNDVDFEKSERNNQIMQGFAKALWKVLKQYKEKLEEAENQVQSLRESLKSEKAKYTELDKEMKDLKSHCSCGNEKAVKTNLPDEKPDSKLSVDDSSRLKEHGSSNLDERLLDSPRTPKHVTVIPECNAGKLPESEADVNSCSKHFSDRQVISKEDAAMREVCNTGDVEESEAEVNSCSKHFSDPQLISKEDAAIREVCYTGGMAESGAGVNSCGKHFLDPQLISVEDAAIREVCYTGDVAESEAEVNSCSKPFLGPQLISKEDAAIREVCYTGDVAESEAEVNSCSKHFSDPQIISKEDAALREVCYTGDVAESEAEVNSCSKHFSDPQLVSKEDAAIKEVCYTGGMAESGAGVNYCSKRFLDRQLISKEDAAVKVCYSGGVAESEAEVNSCSKHFSGPQLISKEDVAIREVCYTGDVAESEAGVSSCSKYFLDPQLISKEDGAIREVYYTGDVAESEAEVHSCSKPFMDSELISKVYVTVTEACEAHDVTEREAEVNSCSKPLLAPPFMPKEDAAVTRVCNTGDVPKSEAALSSCRKAFKAEKPRRRLLPVSSILLRDMGALDLDDENQKPRGTRGGKKSSANDINRTQGSISLLRLLKSNLRH